MAKFNMFAQTNARDITKQIRTRFQDFRKLGDEYAKTVADVFVEKAKQRLSDSGYNVGGLVDNIYSQRTSGYGNYRIGIKPNKDKEVMFYLEYGTGYVGKENPHPLSAEENWDYTINEGADWYFDTTNGYQDIYSIDAFVPRGRNKLGENVGTKGWFYRDKKTGQLRATSGLKAVAYMYDTMQDIDNVKAEAQRRLGNGKQSVSRRRIIRK